MATVVVEATESEPSGSIANPAASTSPSLSHRFLDSKFYLLVVVGETVTEEHLRRAIGNIELGKLPLTPRDAHWETRKRDPTQGATATQLPWRAPHPCLSRSPPALELDSSVNFGE
ncbi:Microtubule-associated protein 1B [Sciurus carolinensis]|uniref:Microtubule-associated protein 1B n=1 Tax=Sciurus carolinensis TaxID=30640 RepID=A0AA41MVG7_SCICA|nr:Microtubule-associated protein 1B [Sciurus carolinensis]